jgi:hypothetical protein
MSRNSVVVELQGGLGNQLFGWAAGYALSRKLNCKLILDRTNLYQRGYQIDSFQFGSSIRTFEKYKIWPSQLRPLLSWNVFKEDNFEYDLRFAKINKPVVLRGYFQSWKYHFNYSEEIYSLVRVLAEESPQLRNLRSTYEFDQLVAVHVRRGDYTQLEDYHGTLNAKYYLDALSHVEKSEQKVQKYVVFSDDPDEAKHIVPGAISYIGPNELSSPAENLVLMSQCKSLVGANSSFSLWAGMLMKSESQIRIFPTPWFTKSDIRDADLVPPNYIRIEKF